MELGLSSAPVQLLRSFRGAAGLVALFGAWADGSSIIACDPLPVGPKDPFEGVEFSHEQVDAVDTEGVRAVGGGWIGAWSYQLGRDLEEVGPSPPRRTQQPHLRAKFYDRILRHTGGRWYLERISGLLEPHRERERDQVLLDWAGRPAIERAWSFTPFDWDRPPAAHVEAIRHAQEMIAQGEIFQANITTGLHAQFRGDLLDVFCAGYDALKPQYAAFLADDHGAIASFSPELFLRRRGREVMTSPIKGTAALDVDPADLLSSEKERAENVMIVDLMRNDLARICAPGSVRTPALTRVESGSVHHLVSDVSGRLRLGVGDGSLLRATFPPGSITGAPKVRAMQIINEVESMARESYTGAIGFVSPFAGLEMNVAIRTIEQWRDEAWMGVGGAVTALSVPQLELAECVTKAAPILRAVGAHVREPRLIEPRELIGPRKEVADEQPPLRRRNDVPTVLRAKRFARVLVLDNYDSFVFNLVHDLEALGATSVDVIRTDQITVAELCQRRSRGAFTHLLLSPGSGHPRSAGVMVDAVRELGPSTPTLGVCLGHQAIGEAYGSRCQQAPEPVHGTRVPQLMGT